MENVKKLNEKQNIVRNKAEVQAWINRDTYLAKIRSFDLLFKKTREEKILLANLKYQNRQKLKAEGYNPNKRFNTSEPFYAKIW